MDLEKFKELHEISVIIEITDRKQVQMFMADGMLLLAINPNGEGYGHAFTYCLGWPKDKGPSYPKSIEHHIFKDY